MTSLKRKRNPLSKQSPSKKQSKEESTQQIAYVLYQRRLLLKRLGDSQSDWETAEKIAEDPLRKALFRWHGSFIALEKNTWEPALNWASNQALLSLLGLGANVGLIVAVATYVGSEKHRRNAEVLNAWQTITNAHMQAGNGGRIQALEFLNASPGANWRRKFPWVCAPSPQCLWPSESLDGINLAVETDTELTAVIEKNLVDSKAEPAITIDRVYLRDLNLVGASLQGANLQGVDLSGANLTDADLKYANLKGALLVGTNLSGSDLTYANLENANLTQSNLREANLSQANLSGALIALADLTETHIYGASFQNASLYGSNFNRALLWSSSFKGSDLESAKFNQADLGGANLSQSIVTKSTDFSNAHLRGVNLEGIILEQGESGVSLDRVPKLLSSSDPSEILELAPQERLEEIASILEGSSICQSSLPEGMTLSTSNSDC